MMYAYEVHRSDGTKLVAPAGPPATHILVEGLNLFTGISEMSKRFGALSTIEHDLLVLASSIFAADRASRRGEREDLCRTITIKMAVFNVGDFVALKNDLRMLLRQLSQDSWDFHFTALAPNFPHAPPADASIAIKQTPGRTLLFSGGLDSLAAAVEFGKDPLTLVSHVTRNSITKGAQQQIADLLASKAYLVEHEQYFVSSADGGPSNLSHAIEPSQRTRSLVFLVLGAIAARRTGRTEVIFMAENGQMAIHLPLTTGRIGAFSTHTAHPAVLSGAEAFFSKMLQFELKIVNPYVYKTKAEIARHVSTDLPDAIELSTSCWKNARVMSAGIRHCGVCIPCLIRRIAIEFWQPDPTGYARDLLSENISELPEDDDGRRNFADLAEFIVRFRSLSADDIMCEFPELYSSHFSASHVIGMYSRFAAEALTVLSHYPQTKVFLS